MLDVLSRAIYVATMISRKPPTRKARGADPLKLESQLCFAIYSTQLGLNRVYRRLLKGLDLTYPQYLVMLVLWEHDELNVSEICSQMYLETTTLTPLLKRMEARGLLTRERSSTDERQVIVGLTPEGRAMRAQALNIPVCVAKDMESSMDTIDDLRKRLEVLRSALYRNA
jgi:DNA-binding MarR family transcriptional regulator